MQTNSNSKEYLLDIANTRLWNHDDLEVCIKVCNDEDASIKLNVIPSLEGIDTDNDELFKSQGYYLKISENEITLKYENNAGYIYGITSIIRLLQKKK